MSDFEREDLELKAMMGDKFQDMSNAQYEPKGFPKCPEANVAQKPAYSPTETTEWMPPKRKHNWMDGLRECATKTLIFGGLNLLIFYWQMKGLVDESVALPCMCVCAALLGLGIGKVVGGKKYDG